MHKYFIYYIYLPVFSPILVKQEKKKNYIDFYYFRTTYLNDFMY